MSHVAGTAISGREGRPQRHATGDGTNQAFESPIQIGLNRSERVYLSLEGVAGAIAQTHVLQFATAHSSADIRTAVRELIRTTPRLRAQTARGWFGWHLEVMPEGAAVDRAFATAFSTMPVDAAALDQCLAMLVNQPFDLEHQLPLRVRVLTGGSTPIVIFNLHHIVCDGRGMMELLTQFMGLLGGRGADGLPLDSPTMVPALLPWPRSFLGTVGSLWRSFWLHRSDRKQHRLPPITSLRPGDFGPTNVHLHVSRAPLAEIKRAAAAHGHTITELVVAALAQSFARGVRPDGTHAVTARFSLDLRPYFPAGQHPRFGNYVASFLVHLARWNDLNATLRDVRTQMRVRLARFADRHMSYPLLLAALTPRLLGRRLLARAARALRRRGRLQPITFHVSNLGTADALNRVTPRAQLTHLHFFAPAVGPYVGCVGVGNRLCVAITHAAQELSTADVAAIFVSFDSLLRERMQEGRAER